MKIKNLFFAVSLSAVLFTAAVPNNSYAAATPTATTAGDPVKDAKMLSDITARVTEIQNMDKSNLTTSEKKALKKELYKMKKDASGLDSKVYISVGAIIIIILLLILIL